LGAERKVPMSAPDEIAERGVSGGQPVAIVTGASRGLGRAIALELANRGVSVAVCARNLQACKAVAAEVREAGGTAAAFDCDVSNPLEVERLVEQVRTAFGHIDILVNNAGTIEPIGAVEECDPDGWEESLRVNLTGPFRACRAVLPHFENRGGGVIVNISSGAAHAPKLGWSAYCAGKAGLAMLTRSIALEAGDRGVLAYGFQPGVVDTEMQSIIRASGVNEVSRIPREQLADPHVPARLVAILCITRPADLNGQDLSIRDPALVDRLEAA
jgi:NAD(P)-dependent dehydrogenase (short-subunit alcohol dehydrogenase family)